MKVTVKDVNLKVVAEKTITVPDWATHVTLEGGVITAWNYEPQWRNGEFYFDPLFEFEEVGKLDEKFELLDSFRAVRTISSSRGVILFWCK